MRVARPVDPARLLSAGEPSSILLLEATGPNYFLLHVVKMFSLQYSDRLIIVSDHDDLLLWSTRPLYHGGSCPRRGSVGWARAPLLLSQLIQLGLAWSFHGSNTDWISVVLAVPALFVTVVLLLPRTTAATLRLPAPGTTTPYDALTLQGLSAAGQGSRVVGRCVQAFVGLREDGRDLVDLGQ